MGTKCGKSSVQQWRTYHSTNEHHNHPNYLLLTDMTMHYNQSSKLPQFKPPEFDFTTYVPTWWTNVGWPIKHTHGIVLIRVWLSCISSSILIYIFSSHVSTWCCDSFVWRISLGISPIPTPKRKGSTILFYIIDCSLVNLSRGLVGNTLVDTCLMLHSNIIWTLHDSL